jgi:hypothetical protein
LSHRSSRLCYLLRVILLVALSIVEPVLELLGRLAYALADLDVDVLLASPGAPRLQNVLGAEIVVVDLHQDRGDLGNELRLVVADEALDTAKESLLVLLRGDHLLQHGGAGVDLLDNLVGEEGLRDDGERAVLVLDAKLLCLQKDLDIVKLVNAALLCGSVEDPLSEDIVAGVALTALVSLDDKSTLEVIRELLGAGAHGLLGGINVPLNLLGLLFDILSTLLDLAGELVVTASLDLEVAIIVAILGAVARAAAVRGGGLALGLGFLAGTTLGLLGGLVLLALLGLVLQDKGSELQARVDLGDLAAGFAVKGDVAVLDVNVGLGVLALLAENEFGDEAVEVVLELARIVGAVDDPAVVVGAGVGLGSQLEAKVLDDVSRRAGQGLSDAAQIDDDGLDTVALALDLGLQALHLVAVEGVGDIATDVDGSHGDGGGGLTGWWDYWWCGGSRSCKVRWGLLTKAERDMQ